MLILALFTITKTWKQPEIHLLTEEWIKKAWNVYVCVCVYIYIYIICSVTKCSTLCNPTDNSTPGFPVLHYLPEFAQTHVHWVNDAIQPSYPLSPPLILPSIFPSIRVFSSESVLCIRWPKHWSFSFSIRPSNEYSGLISFRIDWFYLRAVQGTLSKGEVVRPLCCFLAMSGSFATMNCKPTRLLWPWDFPDKSTRVGCHFLLQWIFLTQESNPRLLLGRWILYHWATREALDLYILCQILTGCALPQLGYGPGRGGSLSLRTSPKYLPVLSSWNKPFFIEVLGHGHRVCHREHLYNLQQRLRHPGLHDTYLLLHLINIYWELCIYQAKIS